MKKKILLIICMLFVTFNVKALSFNVELTNIEDKTNNTSVGTITNIDVNNKELDVLFENEGEQVSFEVTVSNTGKKAGTLKNINVTSTSQKIDYTNNLPEGGLAINGNDTNKVLITAIVKSGATKGKSSSEIKLTYDYEEGTCPEGETLSEDETECLCPEGYERNEAGKCVKPESEVINCEKDEIYNETKKICEKKVTPIPEDTPKTGDNIILITLLFILAGLALYVFLFKKFKSVKTRRTFGIVTAVTTLCVSLLVLITIFGVDGLLGAIINPITKSKEIVIKVNEDIDLIEVWDGDCDVTGALTPDNVFNGGSGTESDPYQIKTANQLACFAKSVNEGTTYEGQFVKQTKNIKLNDNLNDQVTAGDLSGAKVWISAGYKNNNSQDTKPFMGTYNGNNKKISGLYITNDSNIAGNYRGLFGYTVNATIKDLTLSDVYLYGPSGTAALIGGSSTSLILDNIATYGSANMGGYSAGIVSSFTGDNTDNSLLKIVNTTNNINITSPQSVSGFIHYVEGLRTTDEPNMILENDINNGNISFAPSIAGGIAGYINSKPNLKIDNCHNTGNFTFTGTNTGSQIGGIVGASGGKITITNSSNIGDWSGMDLISQSGGIFGTFTSVSDLYAENLYNSGDLLYVNAYPEGGAIPSGRNQSYVAGLFGYAGTTNSFILKNSYNTGKISGRLYYGAGLVGHAGKLTSNDGESILMENCYNLGEIVGAVGTGGLVGYFRGTINKSYNKGTIINFGGSRAGGLVGWGEAKIYNSYNEGNIIDTAEGGNQVAGLCPQDCYEIKNSYNRGNITSYYSGVDIGGIQALSKSGGTIIENVYNSGNITYLDQPKPSGASTNSPALFGIVSGQYFTTTNVYNLGDITIHQNNTGSNNSRISGISSYGVVTNAVNKGKVTIKINEPYSTNKNLYLGGISSEGGSVNGFNAGVVSVDDSALDHSIYDEEFNGNKHQIILGEITGDGRNGNSNNKYNSNPNGKALGCYGFPEWTSCTLEINEAAGTYTTESAPDILSIINGDDAFEIKPGETLPTLKVFNQ